MRDFADLLDTPDSAWLSLIDSLDSSFARHTVLRAHPDQCRTTFAQLQVSPGSLLGALALHSGGILLHDGWLRIYGGSGGGYAGLPGLAEVNRFPAQVEPGWQPPARLVLAHDVLGGVFALSGMQAASDRDRSVQDHVEFFSPLTLAWQDLGMGHRDWLDWLMHDGAVAHYRDLLWPTWRTEVAELRLRDGIAVFPGLWTEEAQEKIGETMRHPMPMEQILRSFGVACAQLGLGDPGGLGVVAV